MPTALAAILVASVDQGIKAVLAPYLESQIGWQIWVFEPIVKLRLVHNSGFVFGVLSGSVPQWFVSAVVMGAIAAILFIFARQIQYPTVATRIVFGLTLGGAVGNLIDRFRLGYVIDYVDFGWWPVFNFADSAINIAILMFVVLMSMGRVQKHPSISSPFMN